MAPAGEKDALRCLKGSVWWGSGRWFACEFGLGVGLVFEMGIDGMPRVILMW